MGSAASRDVSGIKTITLISADSERFEVPEAAASLSQVIRNAIENGSAGGGGIRLSKIPGKVLGKVLEYCNKHAAGAGGSSGDATSSGEATKNNDEELRTFDEEFIDDVDQFMLYDLLLGAYYLEVQGLVDLAWQKVADRLEDKTRVEMRKTFRIKDDYFPPPDEVDEKQWLFV